MCCAGGLLICLPREQAAKYCSEIKKVEGHHAWIIGIDEMLSSMRYGMPLKEVRQFEGMLITVFRDDLEMKNLDRYRTVINKKEQELYSIDMDLHIDQEIDKCLVKCLN